MLKLILVQDISNMAAGQSESILENWTNTDFKWISD